jgi:hypothetical protein
MGPARPVFERAKTEQTLIVLATFRLSPSEILWEDPRLPKVTQGHQNYSRMSQTGHQLNTKMTQEECKHDSKEHTKEMHEPGVTPIRCSSVF